MSRLPQRDLIDFLVDQKFPGARRLQIPPSLALLSDGTGTIDPEFREKRLKEIDEYRRKLLAMTPKELQERWEAEQEKASRERARRADEEEQKRFFNLPSAEADFDHWSKATYWTLEEAIALSFGKDPEKVDWDTLIDTDYGSPSPFIEKYRKVRDLALRARNSRQLSDPCYPTVYLAWARRSKIEVPLELVELVEAQGTEIADWKDLYDKLKENYDALSEAHAALSRQLEPKEASDSNPIGVTQSKYWNRLEKLADKAIHDFPSWSQKQRKIQRTGNLQGWLGGDIGADNREAEILKKILSDLFKELR
jgi:hypothetical protein